jgi:hypothetical protein
MSQSNIPVMCLTIGMTCPVNANFFDNTGAPYTPAATPFWSTDDSLVATVSASADGLTGSITANALGETFIHCSADGETSKVCVIVEDPDLGYIDLIPGGV